MAEPAEAIRVQRKRTKGWRMPKGTVYVGRPTRWGNPFDFRASEYCWAALSYGCRGDRRGRIEASVRAFRDWIAPRWGRRSLLHEEQPKMGSGDKWVKLGPRVSAGEAPPLDDLVRELRGKNLACWCPLDQPCHADVLLALANRAEDS